jgi:hypothetical protein
MGRAGYTARIDENGKAHRVLWDRRKERKGQEDQDIGENIMLRWDSDRTGRYGLHLCVWGYGPVEVSCEGGSQPSGAITFWEVLEQWLNWWRHKMGSKQTPWPLVRRRTIPTERPPLVDEIQCQLLWIEGCCLVIHGRYSQFSRPEPLLFFQVAPHLSSQGLNGSRSRHTGTQKIW